MNIKKVRRACNTLDNAICKLDVLLRQYPFVLTIDLAKSARLQLENTSKLLNNICAEIDNENAKNSEDDSNGTNVERNSRVEPSDGEVGNKDGEVDNPDDGNDSSVEEPRNIA